MNEAGWNEDNDEMFGDMLFCELNKIHKNNFK